MLDYPGRTRISKASDFHRAGLALAMYASGDPHANAKSAVAALMERNDEEAADCIRRKGVSALESSGIPIGTRDFVNSFAHESFVERVVANGAVEADLEIPVAAAGSGFVGSWVAEGDPSPTPGITLNTLTLQPRKIVALTSFTRETLRTPRAEDFVGNEIRRGSALVADRVFCDYSNAGSSAQPPSPFFNANHASEDLSRAPARCLDLLPDSADPSHGLWLTTPTVAAALSTYTSQSGAFQYVDVSAKGGFLLGLPLYVTRGAPIESSGGFLGLVDCSALAIALGAAQLEASTALAMSLSPGAPASLVSMFQTNSVAVKSTQFLNWGALRDCAAYVTVSW